MFQITNRTDPKNHQINIHLSDDEMIELLITRLGRQARSNQEVIRAALTRAYKETTRRMEPKELTDARKAAEHIIEQIKKGRNI